MFLSHFRKDDGSFSERRDEGGLEVVGKRVVENKH